MINLNSVKAKLSPTQDERLEERLEKKRKVITAFHFMPFVLYALFCVKISLNVLWNLLLVANATKDQVRKSQI